MDLHFSSVFPLDGATHFLFVKNYFFKKDLKSPLIFVLFLKGKQNKKENPKYDSLKRKDKFEKTQI